MPLPSAQGWGTFSQKAEGGKLSAQIAVRWGKLSAKTIALNVATASTVRVSLEGKDIVVTSAKEGSRLTIAFESAIRVVENETLIISIA